MTKIKASRSYIAKSNTEKIFTHSGHNVIKLQPAARDGTLVSSYTTWMDSTEKCALVSYPSHVRALRDKNAYKRKLKSLKPKLPANYDALDTKEKEDVDCLRKKALNRLGANLSNAFLCK